jgi:hypothetical protein
VFGDSCLTVEGFLSVVGFEFVSFHDEHPFFCCYGVVSCSL